MEVKINVNNAFCITSYVAITLVASHSIFHLAR